MHLVRIGAGLALMIAASPSPAAASAAAGRQADPNRMICKSKPVVGSRLKRVRECHTAQEWEDLKLQEQVGMLRKQFNGDPGCSGSSSQSCNPIASGGRDTPW